MGVWEGDGELGVCNFGVIEVMVNEGVWNYLCHVC